MIRLFHFPSFEEWLKYDKKFKQTIGEFTCVFHPTTWYMNSGDVRYECAIASCDNPTNVYVTPVVGWAFRCDSADTELLMQKYHESIREVNARWISYIENNYLVSGGMLFPELISLRSILIAAFCTSGKKEMPIKEVQELLSTLRKEVYDGDEYRIFAEIPETVDEDYLEQIVMHDYSCFRICRDYIGIRIIDDVNPSQMYFKWEIKNPRILEIIKNFYNPRPSCGW